MSLATFKRQFKKTYNENPSKYISSTKVNKAKIELKNKEN